MAKRSSMTIPASARPFRHPRRRLTSFRQRPSRLAQNRTAEYSPFGEIYAPNTTVSVEQRYTYTGRETAINQQAMFNRHRWNYPGIGRYSTRWFTYRFDANLYTYQFNRPLIFIDPYGDPLGDASPQTLAEMGKFAEQMGKSLAEDYARAQAESQAPQQPTPQTATTKRTSFAPSWIGTGEGYDPNEEKWNPYAESVFSETNHFDAVLGTEGRTGAGGVMTAIAKDALSSSYKNWLKRQQHQTGLIVTGISSNEELIAEMKQWLKNSKRPCLDVLNLSGHGAGELGITWTINEKGNAATSFDVDQLVTPGLLNTFKSLMCKPCRINYCGCNSDDPEAAHAQRVHQSDLSGCTICSCEGSTFPGCLCNGHWRCTSPANIIE
jgi:RHS repeat-associated protein